VKNQIVQKDVVAVTAAPITQDEYRLIVRWLDSRFHHAIGLTAFLDQTQLAEARWKLLRLYESHQPDALLGVAVILAGGTCFWLPEEISSAGWLCSEILKFQPRRIVSSSFGRDLLRSFVGHHACLVQEYDQWIMVCMCHFPQASGRLAIASDIPRLIEYQHLYNQERSVKESSNWDLLIQQAKIMVYEIEGQIVSIVRLGIETHRLVSIGGTYTFPAYRRQGYAERVLAFAINQIIESGRIAHLIVDMDNSSAIELYRKMGFECVGSSYVGYLAYS
jgi:ribosomal protein S18 acetylase RimI-like enzyme